MGGANGSQEHRLEALERRVERLRAFGSLRRKLRVTEDSAEIAAAGVRFALDVLGCTHFAIYCGERDDSDFDLVSAPPSRLHLPAAIERRSDLAQQLASAPSASGRDLLDGSLAPGAESIVVGLRASPTTLIGMVVAVGTALDTELVDELAFDLESALSARMIARLRAEELAVLEIQERELVGLLRDVEARDRIIQEDLAEARRFQHQMLGAAPRVPGASIEVLYHPVGLIGGDLYAISVDGERLRLFVADATGHGVRASLTTMFIKSEYEVVQATAPNPAALLTALNDAIADTYRSTEMLFTAVCVDIDLATGRVVAASAAHPPICVVVRGEPAFISGGGTFLGVRTEVAFANEELTLSPGDGVYLYTDGFVEARKQDVFFGDERLITAVTEAHDAGRPVGEAVATAVTSFLDGTPFDDDRTFVGVRIA